MRLGYGFSDNLTINSLGNIGIGTASPVGDGLTIVGGDTGQDFLTLDRPNIGKFRFNAGGYNTRFTISSGNTDQFSIGYDNTKGGLALTKDIGFANHAHAVFLKNNGYLGIGNTNPQYLLDASGNIRAQQHLITGGGVSNGRVYIRDINNNQKILLQSDGDSYFNSGNVGIGTTNPDPNFKFSVNGSIRSKEVKVEANWSDFVFYDNYKLLTLEEVEEHISKNGHLPEIPSEAEVNENGINLGEMNAKLLQKIEELTLYLIEQNKEIKELKERVNSFETNKDHNRH